MKYIVTGFSKGILEITDGLNPLLGNIVEADTPEAAAKIYLENHEHDFNDAVRIWTMPEEICIIDVITTLEVRK